MFNSRSCQFSQKGLLRAASQAKTIRVHPRVSARLRRLRDAGGDLHFRVAGGKRRDQGEASAFQLHI